MDIYHKIDCGFYIFYIKESTLSNYKFKNKQITIDMLNRYVSNFNTTYRANITNVYSCYNFIPDTYLSQSK